MSIFLMFVARQIRCVIISYLLFLNRLQATQHEGQAALIPGNKLYFVKDSSADNRNILAPWARASELKENSVY